MMWPWWFRTRTARGELRSALNTAETVADMLEELGLGADSVDEDAAAQGVLERRRMAILAHNPGLTDETVAALERFVRGGGKVLVCYQLPPRLGELLGFGHAKYTRPARPDEFAEIRFTAADIAGLPLSVRQNSWNITVAEPDGQHAQVIGRWFDSQGRATGHAAMLLSDRGAFFSHILLSDDRSGKKQLLAAVVGHFVPVLWERMVQSEMAATKSIGHCTGASDLARYVKRSQNADAAERFETAQSLLALAENRFRQQEYPQAVERIREARRLLDEAYLRHSQPGERRPGVLESFGDRGLSRRLGPHGKRTG